ncbi:MAG: membrane protein insertase YidC [Tepidanaerobacter acetatoxydans]|uniref:Membrane protein insertase YidC n=1 Tax=Tepidanaerobacter acetatoxydans (strain DSM 21804 / JCM 16047 / Re1) TaxID=1209989 RepID=F4LV89_TEPAE|nr:YidC/Oxa1 family membrane protein insertase [Tepidanaerobacter acetatoxydans]AEE92736.1 membrane protein insertase, YidC/Oxa1 family [Tepidanaerobacter acetatoxydans Re1]NLU11153.1 membrane protein insertase YidC [Tepidanaerobacter acetatoxydans]CCP27720.1 Membrane protein insertase YidC [Tepidanaerobacter acetatoxydans Re1]
MAFLQDLMKQLMDLIFVYTNSYGIAIILLTVLIKLILLPFSFMQINSMKKMQEITPLQQELQKKYKNDKEKLNMEIMKLYQENKINPMGGCLPLLIQFPVIIALFRVFQTYDFAGASFLWISNLSKPDSTFILPILAAVTTYIQTKLSTPAGADNPNASMNIIMPLMIGWFSVKFAAGLALYWVVSNVVQIVQQLIFARPQAIAKEDVK